MADRKPGQVQEGQSVDKRPGEEPGPERSASERRREARLQPDASHLMVGDDPWVYLINVSSAGLAFYTDRGYKPGDTVRVRVDGGPGTVAKVVQCQTDLAEPGAIAGPFRVSAEFTDPAQGMQLFVALRDLEIAHLDIGSD